MDKIYIKTRGLLKEILEASQAGSGWDDWLNERSIEWQKETEKVLTNNTGEQDGKAN